MACLVAAIGSTAQGQDVGKSDTNSFKDTAQEAYVYAFPMLMNYGVMHSYFIDRNSGQYKVPFNTMYSEARVFTPKDTAVITPNSDTPYSFVGMDLRAEPIVLCHATVEKSRYFVIQLVDMYTFNYGYMGSRATGNEAACFMVAGPDWKGETPAGIKKVFHSETQFGLAVIRTQLFGPKDIDNVKKVQADYKVQTLSQFLNKPAPPPAPAIDWPTFTKDDMKGPFATYLNFLLQFCPPVAEEKTLRARFATIGIAPGKPFDVNKLSDAQKSDLMRAIKDGYAAIDQKRNNFGTNVNGWLVGSILGDRILPRRLGAACRRRHGGHLRQQCHRGDVPAREDRFEGRAARWQQARLHSHIHRRPISAGQRLLVGDNVRRQDAAADRESDQPLPDQLADVAADEEECGRFAHALHPEGFTRARRRNPTGCLPRTGRSTW